MSKYNKEQLAELCGAESIAYTIQNYLNIDDIEDIEIRKLARKAKDALDQLERILDI